MDDPVRQIEVTYQFFLPDNIREVIMFQNAHEMMKSLYDINNLCYRAIKNGDDSAEKMAREILELMEKIPLEEM